MQQTNDAKQKLIQEKHQMVHSQIEHSIKSLEHLNKLLFYDEYTTELTPELLYKYQETDV